MAIPRMLTMSGGNLQCKLAISYDEEADTLCGGASLIDLRTGKVVGSRSLCVPIGEIRAAVEKALVARRNSLPAPIEEDAISGLWSTIKSRAKSVAKKVGVKKLARLGQRLLDDPRFQKLGTMASIVYPPLGLTLAQLQSASKMLKAAREGDMKAQLDIMKVRRLAELGNPKAENASRALLALNQAAKEGKDTDAVVAGWLYNRPYRSNLEAGALGKSPGSFLRRMYHDAVNR